MESYKRIEMTSDSAVILVYTKTEAGIKEVHRCFFNSPNHYQLRNALRQRTLF